MKIDFSDGISDELNTPVKFRWVLRASLFSAILAIVIYLCAKAFFLATDIKEIRHNVKQYKIERLFDQSAYGTFWTYCGVDITADHVPAAMVSERYKGRQIIRSNGLIDAAYVGSWKCDKPRDIIIGETATLIGFPSGSKHAAIRRGKVYLKRAQSGSPGYQNPTWIASFGKDYEPVAKGMSGGIVLDSEGLPIGVIVTQNSPTDLDRDGFAEHSADFVSLRDMHSYLIESEE